MVAVQIKGSHINPQEPPELLSQSANSGSKMSDSKRCMAIFLNRPRYSSVLVPSSEARSAPSSIFAPSTSASQVLSMISHDKFHALSIAFHRPNLATRVGRLHSPAHQWHLQLLLCSRTCLAEADLSVPHPTKAPPNHRPQLIRPRRLRIGPVPCSEVAMQRLDHLSFLGW